MITMETPQKPGNWSNLPLDIVISVLERLSFVDFQRAKRVCSNWYFGSKQTFPRKRGSPWLILSPVDDGGCMLYNPDEDKVYRTERDFSGSRFLANSGNWFLMLDSGSNLSIIDLFSKETIPLPSLESICSSTSTIRRVGETNRFERDDGECTFKELSSDVVRGLLWVDKSGKEYVVVWLFDLPGHSYISFCKNGDTHYTEIPLFNRDCRWLDDLSDMVLKGYSLYISSSEGCVRVLDLSTQQGSYKEITENEKPFPMLSGAGYNTRDSSIAVTTSGEVLLVVSDQSWHRACLRLYKKNPNIINPCDSNNTLLEVNSLGGEALLLDLGLTVPANDTLGIEPDSIYFTRHFRLCHCCIRLDLDICVFNLVTKTLKRVNLAGMNLVDARWFLPGSS